MHILWLLSHPLPNVTQSIRKTASSSWFLLHESLCSFDKKHDLCGWATSSTLCTVGLLGMTRDSPLSCGIGDWLKAGWELDSDWLPGGWGGIWLPVKHRRETWIYTVDWYCDYRNQDAVNSSLSWSQRQRRKLRKHRTSSFPCKMKQIKIFTKIPA